MPSWVELCFLDMAFTAPEANIPLAKIHIFGVPGFKKSSGQTVISPSVQTFLKNFITERLFRQSQFLTQCPFDGLNLWLYDSTLAPEERTYDMPILDKLDQVAVTFATKTSMSRLKAVQVIGSSIFADDVWQSAVNTLFRSLFIEFINMPDVPLYFIKFPILDEDSRPTSAIDLYPDSPKTLLFDSILIETWVTG
ncbi:MAG: hypothetical protein AAF152_07775 [Cyanobacteria bacterium P01_A01_bin.114]